MFDGIQRIFTRLNGYNFFEVLLELLLISAVVYIIFRFLRGTRGARVLVGGGVVLLTAMILVALVGADNAGFDRIRFLLDKVILFTAFALVIVFQPELRRALVRLGEGRIFNRTNITDSERAITQIVKSVAYLSKNKVGAIMAIERSVGLKGIEEAGTPINADLTAELLNTIFWPGSALHDMGVVIRGAKVIAAGVQFPLSEGDELAQELGSRHRAAVGLSLEADCLVVVVSEETGAITLAERGHLLRKLSTEGLRSMLKRGLSQQTTEATDPETDPDPEPSKKSKSVSESKPSAAKPSSSVSSQPAPDTPLTANEKDAA